MRAPNRQPAFVLTTLRPVMSYCAHDLFCGPPRRAVDVDGFIGPAILDSWLHCIRAESLVDATKRPSGSQGGMTAKLVSAIGSREPTRYL
jgi:hypothetical protein